MELPKDRSRHEALPVQPGNPQAMLQNWREAVPNDRLGLLINDALRGLRRAFQTRLAGHSVALGHWAFLRILWEKDGLTQKELSERAGVMEPTTFSALKAMERLGIITRRRIAGNRKKVFIYLTPKGRLLKTRLIPLAEEVNETALRDIKPGEIAATRRALRMIIENMAHDEIETAMKERRIPSTREWAERGAAVAKTKRARPKKQA